MVKRNLGTMERDMFQALGRPIQEAFRDGFSGRIIRGGLLAGQSHQGVYEESSAKNYELGSVLVKPDGREFVYSKAGGSGLSIAVMHQAPAPTSDWAETAQAGGGISAGETSGTVIVGGTDPGADGWKDGFLVVNKGTNTGQMYKIKSNTALYSSTKVDVTLYDAVVKDIATGDEITVIANPYNGTIVVPSGGLSAQVIGVPLIAVTANYYYWSQISGPAPLLVDTGDTVVIGQMVGLPKTAAVDGACGPITVDTTTSTDLNVRTPWGQVITVAAADEYAIVDLKIGV